MDENIIKIIGKIKSIFGDSIFSESNKKQLISAVKDFAEDYEDEEFLVKTIENDDYEDGKSCLLDSDFESHQEVSDSDSIYGKKKIDEATLKKIKKFLKQKNLKLSPSELQIVAEAVANNANQDSESSKYETERNSSNHEVSQKIKWKSLDDDSINGILGRKKVEQNNQDERPVSIGCLAFILLIVFVVPTIFVTCIQCVAG